MVCCGVVYIKIFLLYLVVADALLETALQAAMDHPRTMDPTSMYNVDCLTTWIRELWN